MGRSDEDISLCIAYQKRLYPYIFGLVSKILYFTEADIEIVHLSDFELRYAHASTINSAAH